MSLRLVRRRSVVPVVICLAAAAVAATAGGSTAGSKKQVRIAFSGFAAANSFTQATYAGIKAAAKQQGASVTFLDANFDATKQVALIQDAATSGRYDAILIHANNNVAIVPAVRQAIAAKLKVISVFVPIGPNLATIQPQVPGLTASVGMTPASTGVNTGKLIVSACGSINPCKVAYLPGNKTLPLEGQRTSGVMSVLKSHANIKVVSTQEGGYTADAGLKAAQNVIQAHSDINVIASDDQAVRGAAIAVASAGLKRKVKLIGQGASRQAIAGIRNGTWYGSALYLPYSEGYKAAQIAIAAVNGKKYPKVVNSYTLSKTPGAVSKVNVGSFKGEWTS
jgi:ribose transport system substrate-binding protein